MVWLHKLTNRIELHILSNVTPQAFPTKCSLDVVHSPMHSHVSNEGNIVVLFHDLLPKGPWNQHLFTTILHTVQYPLRGVLQILIFELFLGYCHHFLNVWVNNLGLEEPLSSSLGQWNVHAWIKLNNSSFWSWACVKSTSIALACFILAWLDS